ncbi:hypothetical protein D3C86_1904470 [compost metagenome]
MRVGKSSVKNAPMPLKIPEAKKPKGNPSQSITLLLTGNWVYSKTMMNEPTANRMKFFLRPRMSVKYALMTYPT